MPQSRTDHKKHDILTHTGCISVSKGVSIIIIQFPVDLTAGIHLMSWCIRSPLTVAVAVNMNSIVIVIVYNIFNNNFNLVVYSCVRSVSIFWMPRLILMHMHVGIFSLSPGVLFNVHVCCQVQTPETVCSP